MVPGTDFIEVDFGHSDSTELSPELASLLRTILPKCIPGTVLVGVYSRYGRLVLSNHSGSLWYACYTGEPEKLTITFSRFP